MTHLSSSASSEKKPQVCNIFAGTEERLLAACDYFTVYHLAVKGQTALYAGADSFQCLTVLSGSLTLHSEEEALNVQQGESIFLPAGLGCYVLNGYGELILSKV